MKDSPDMLQDLENLLNEHRSDIMKQFRQDLPGMNEGYYRLFLFSALGFSDSAISLFLNKQKTSMVWNLRRHLKDKIKQLDNDKKDKYIAILN